MSETVEVTLEAMVVRDHLLAACDARDAAGPAGRDISSDPDPEKGNRWQTRMAAAAAEPRTLGSQAACGAGMDGRSKFLSH